jgi:hypothetical protein
VPWASTIFLVLFAGWFGTERIWYLRAFRGETLGREEIWPLTSAFRRRFIALAFIFGLAMIPAILPFVLISGSPGVIGFFVWILALDAAMTFVTPALAFSTRSVFAAITTGFRLARRAWPASALYMFIPPLAARLAAAVLWNDRISVIMTIVADITAVLLNLLFKGATARFYLRFHDSGEDGAAFEPAEATG